MTQARRPLLLIILDGWGGYRGDEEGNAVLAARTPNLDFLMKGISLVFFKSVWRGCWSSRRSDGNS
jgi:2,3-bisphosphoglycerate-independent phosphoglycerate mutase